MSDGTKIEWADATANVINGCSLESPGCTNCYAMKQAHRTAVRQGLTVKTKGGMVWTGEVRFHEPALLKVLSWRKPRMIFWNAHGDMFHPSVPDEWIDRCFAAMAMTPQHVHQVLTKRSARMREYLTSATSVGRIADAVQPMRTENRAVGPLPHLDGGERWWPLPNVWLGVSVEDQARADERVPDLLATPAAVRWLSCEPLLEPVDLTDIDIDGDSGMDALNPVAWAEEFERWRDSSDNWQEEFLDWYSLPGLPGGDMHPTLDWIVAGGESGPGARPMHPDWARSLRDQCAAAAVPFFFKQWGEWAPGSACVGQIGRFPAAAFGHNGWTRFDHFQSGDEPAGEPDVVLWGKKRAGRELDGHLHDGFPA